MPQIKLTEQCSRCPRVETFDVSLDEAVARVKVPEQRSKALTIVLDGEEVVSYDYLCEECRGIVASYCDGTKRQPKKSTRRFRRVKVGQESRRPKLGAAG